eukprot:TRINITY_DN5119_c0_g1_i1.p1 TRINITY_DN5119_c0_g1~~TRINITY_DN5119_c0_g1_i1.p1  ORF type:complete len:379 (-),score=119.02 TRINITY_DN5119_c0_g1_i1:100-1236(-)
MRVIEKHSQEENEASSDNSEQEDEDEVVDQNIYCICRKRDDGSPMICCDECNEWYHLRCIKMSKKQADSIKRFSCHVCVAKKRAEAEPKQSQVLPWFMQQQTEDQIASSEGFFGSKPPEPSKEKVTRDRGSETKSESFFDQQELIRKRKERQAVEEEHRLKRQKVADEPIRKIAREKFVEVLGRENEHLARFIEAELYKLFHGCGKEYKAKCRTLEFNLKDPKNHQLKESVKNGDITPYMLCRMTTEELAPKELAEYRRLRDEKYLENIVLKEEAAPPKKPTAQPEATGEEPGAEFSPSYVPPSPPSSPAEKEDVPVAPPQKEDEVKEVVIASAAEDDVAMTHLPLADDTEPIAIPSFNEFKKMTASDGLRLRTLYAQ